MVLGFVCVIVLSLVVIVGYCWCGLLYRNNENLCCVFVLGVCGWGCVLNGWGLVVCVGLFVLWCLYCLCCCCSCGCCWLLLVCFVVSIQRKHHKQKLVVGECLVCLSFVLLCLFVFFSWVLCLGLCSLLFGCCFVRCYLCCGVCVVVVVLFVLLLLVWLLLLVVVGMNCCIEATKTPQNKVVVVFVVCLSFVCFFCVCLCVCAFECLCVC